MARVSGVGRGGRGNGDIPCPQVFVSDIPVVRGGEERRDVFIRFRHGNFVCRVGAPEDFRGVFHFQLPAEDVVVFRVDDERPLVEPVHVGPGGHVVDDCRDTCRAVGQ